MKLKLTPLNIFTSALLVAIAYLLIYRDTEGWRVLGSISLFIMAVISFVADVLFRRLLKDLKRIWIIELVFIIFVAILVITLQKIWG